MTAKGGTVSPETRAKISATIAMVRSTATGGWTPEKLKKGWETRHAKMRDAGWVPPAERPKPLRPAHIHGVSAANKARKKGDAERVAAGTRHVVDDLQFGATPWTRCSCGVVFRGRDNDAAAQSFNVHAANANKAARRNGSSPVTSSFDTEATSG